jgi:hypothetical protein
VAGAQRACCELYNVFKNSEFEEWLAEPANQFTGGKEGKTPTRGPMLKPPKEEAEKVRFLPLSCVLFQTIIFFVDFIRN